LGGENDRRPNECTVVLRIRTEKVEARIAAAIRVLTALKPGLILQVRSKG
jgi:hypothetical protein